MKLDQSDHRALVLWATDCAERVLPYFEEEFPNDDRPKQAIEAGRAWVRGEITLSEARAAAFAAHAAARDADQAAARAAARSAGHAAATAHAQGHATHAASYAVTAAAYAAAPANATDAATNERDWQYQHLPQRLQSVAFPASVPMSAASTPEDNAAGAGEIQGHNHLPQRQLYHCQREANDRKPTSI